MPTIRELARLLGLGRTTVSLALRDDPEVAPATRALVQAKARELGYRPDARVTQLMSYLRGAHGKRTRCNLAWFNTGGSRDEWQLPYLRDYLDGARAQAEKYGYAIDEIWVTDPALRLARLPRLLSARGIEGVILPLLFDDTFARHLDWSAHAFICIGESYPEMRVQRVSTNHLHNIHTALRRLHALGYRRPALDYDQTTEETTGTCIWEVFSFYQTTLFPDRPVPIWKSGLDPAFAKWLHTYRPDVIIATNHWVLERVRAAGLRVPEDVAVVHLNLSNDTIGWAGVSQNQAILGRAAIDSLVAQLNRNERGIPPHPKEITLRGEWIDGLTCPPRSAASGLSG